MPNIEIVCGVKELKKNQRRGTMMECAAKKQVRYYGVKKVDKIILDKLTGVKGKKIYTFVEAVGRANGLKTRGKRILEKIERAERKKNDTKVKALKKEYEKVKKEYIIMVPIANKLIQEDIDKREALKKKNAEKSSKSPKKSSKKNSEK
jgi:hypothetical protein